MDGPSPTLAKHTTMKTTNVLIAALVCSLAATALAGTFLGSYIGYYEEENVVASIELGTAGYLYCTNISVDADFEAIAAGVLVSSGTGGVQFVIYDDDSIAPNAYVEESLGPIAVTGPGTYEAPMASPVTLTAGQYWICMHPNTPNLNVSVGTGSNFRYGVSSEAVVTVPFPATFPLTVPAENFGSAGPMAYIKGFYV